MSPQGLHILLVGGDRASIFIATICIEELGHSSEVAYSPLEAIEKAKAGKYAAIIIDLILPDMSGCRVAEIIREFELKTNIRLF